MMKQTLSDLWHGRLTPMEQCGATDPEIKHLIDCMERNRKRLAEGLNEQQQTTLEAYVDCSDEYLCHITGQAFCDGFCLAGRLLTEALADK